PKLPMNTRPPGHRVQRWALNPSDVNCRAPSVGHGELRLDAAMSIASFDGAGLMGERNVLGIDIGGTFTDFFLFEQLSRRTWFDKGLTTTGEPGRGVIDGLAELMATVGTSVARMQIVVHGTTLIANALIERKGARTALITTQGYRDVLEIGTEM